VDGRRRAIWILLGGAVLSLVLLRLLGSSDAASRASSSAIAAAPTSRVDDMTTVAKPARKPIPETEWAELPEPIRRYLESTPYPPSSGRLTRGHEDLLHPNSRYESHRPIPDTLSDDPDRVVTWLFTADHWAYVGPDVVHAWLEVRRGGKPVAVDVVSATATREGAAGPVGAAETLTFVRDGDRLVADLPLARFADHFGPILLSVRFEYERGRFHDDSLRIQSTPASHVPGRVVEMGDRVSNGSLVLDVGADLSVGGFYRFDANVYDADGNPIAFAMWKGELAAGQQTIPLEVWGKVLRDADVPGPYEVREIRGYRFLDGQYPDREMLPATDATHTTAAWTLDAFTDASHVGDDELRMAELMLDDLEAGRPILEPPPAADAVEIRMADDDAEPSIPD
jgi:hypothetical protein